ncbi:MAG: cold-shock protein [Caulobacteraceae bacterium]|nr:cold-shock protein [Caulobacteraceae bacterium]
MASGIVKFFNSAKGFGFIAPDDGGSDVFVHVSAVERAGLDGLNEGDRVAYELEQDRRSGKLAVGELQWMGAGAPLPKAGRAGGYARSPRGSLSRSGDGRAPAGAGSGVVKWFNTQKGFGFIQPEDGGSDVFVHISAVERAGLRSLEEGQAISYDIEQDGRTGKAAATNLRVDR